MKKPWSDLRRENVTNDDLSPSGLKRVKKNKRKKMCNLTTAVRWSSVMRCSLFATVSPITSRSTHNHVKCEMYLNFFSFPSQTELQLVVNTHFSRGYKIPSIFLRPIKRWKKLRNKTNDTMRRRTETFISCCAWMQKICQKFLIGFHCGEKREFGIVDAKWRCALR